MNFAARICSSSARPATAAGPFPAPRGATRRREASGAERGAAPRPRPAGAGTAFRPAPVFVAFGAGGFAAVFFLGAVFLGAAFLTADFPVVFAAAFRDAAFSGDAFFAAFRGEVLGVADDAFVVFFAAAFFLVVVATPVRARVAFFGVAVALLTAAFFVLGMERTV